MSVFYKTEGRRKEKGKGKVLSLEFSCPSAPLPLCQETQRRVRERLSRSCRLRSRQSANVK